MTEIFEETKSPFNTPEDYEVKHRKIRKAVKDLIEACGQSCNGCPIVYLCEREFRSEPWTWGTRCVQGRRTS